MPSLRISDGKTPDRHYRVDRDVISIGRESVNHIQILDTEVSRQHAEVHATPDGSYELVDLDSSNGTYLNHKRIAREHLHIGDRIRIGNAFLTLEPEGGSSRSGTSHLSATPFDVIVGDQDQDRSRIVSNYSHHYASLRDSAGQAISSDEQIDADRSLNVIYQTALAIGRTENLDQVLARILQLVFDWVDADRGCIMLRDNESEPLYPAARRDRLGDHENGKREHISISQTIIEHVLDEKMGVRTSDAKEDQRFQSSNSILSSGVREALCIPLQGRYSIVGILYLDTYTADATPAHRKSGEENGRFTDAQLRLATAIGYQAAVAIEDTHYYSTLVKSERLAAMGHAITSLSHDIKNILQGIRSGTYLIDAGLNQEDTSVIQRGWKMVDRNQERISNLVLNMLTFSKDRVPELKRHDLNEVSQEVFEDFQTQQEELKIRFELETTSEPLHCEIDNDAIHRVLLNLVINAIDAINERNEQGAENDRQTNTDGSEKKERPPTMGSSAEIVAPRTAQGLPSEIIGKISLRLGKADGGHCIIEVQDNGIGVPNETRESLFTLFESSKGTRGTGIGLAVCAKIVNEHQGELVIDTPDDGIGTIFRITLPAKKVETAS